MRCAMRSIGPVRIIAALALLALQPARGDGPIAADVIIRGGTVIDGTGAEARAADVAIRGDRIVMVGNAPATGKFKEIDARGLIIAPGFIDLHTHSDDSFSDEKKRANTNYLTQGVTTVVTGNCGSGPIDVAAYFKALERTGVGTNVIHLIPHGSLRRSVLGNGDAPADAAALARMKEIVDREMNAGAWGMSTGLIYLPGRYASTHELSELAKVVARHQGFYASHIRNEEAGLLDSIKEVIAIARSSGAPAHISHLKANGKPNWGMVRDACDLIEQARASGLKISADQYPYAASSTSLAAMVVPHWARQGGTDGFKQILTEEAKKARLLAEIQKELDARDAGASLRIARYAPKQSRVGMDLVSIAREEGNTPLDVVIDIEVHGGAQAISFGMCEPDVRLVMRKPYVATASDGAAHLPGSGDRPHPRSYGTFPRKVRYALDDKNITLEQAIRSSSGLPAEILGLPDRGVIRAGAYADLIVFDPARFRDQATFDDPTRYASGLKYTFVNGVEAISDGQPTNHRAGRVLRRTTDRFADLIVLARVWTGDRERPESAAIASRGGEIVAVGTEAEIAPFKGPATKITERRGGLVVPGLIDAHAHLISLGAEQDTIDLRGVASPEEVAARVKQWIDDHPDDPWIRGQNWDQSLFPGGQFPTAAALDKVARTRPVWLTRVDGHAGWANTEAMKRASITKETKSPPDGQIIRDRDRNPTGVFVDGAMMLISSVLPPASRDSIAKRILAGQAKCLEAGLTGIHDAGVDAVEAEVFRELDQQGKLKLRVYGMFTPAQGHEVESVQSPPIALEPGRRFEMRAIKLFIDGAMGSRGALLFEPYSDDPTNHGLRLIPQNVLEETTATALRHGWQVCVHAIGDKGNALVLDAFGRARLAVSEVDDPRLRIEHAQVVRKEDVARFKRSGIIASMQPSHASDDMRWTDARLGPKRSAGAYAWRWFLDEKIPLAFGSDFPVEVVDPRWGIYAALTRQDREGQPPGGWHPDQRLTLAETLAAFTSGSAYAGFAERRVGMLRVGMRMDATIFDRDLFKAKPSEILDIPVRETIVDGNVEFAR